MVALVGKGRQKREHEGDRAFFPHGVIAAGIRHEVGDHVGEIGRRRSSENGFMLLETELLSWYCPSCN